MKTTSGQSSSIGKERERNEDSLRTDDTLGLYVVADGVSIKPSGEKASKIVVDTIFDFVRRDRTRDNKTSLLKDALQAAHNNVRNHAKGQPDLKGMGSTAVVMLVEDAVAYVAHVGDSRAYLLRGGQLSRLTQDQHNNKNSLSNNYLGSPTTITPMVRTLDIKGGDHFVLCSDGLSNMANDSQIQQQIQQHIENPTSSATALTALADKEGGEDNSSVVSVVVKSFLGELPSHYVIPGVPHLPVWEGTNIFLK